MEQPWEPSLAVRAQAVASPVSRIALLSLHTCPLDQPGTGDSGGMNVYVRQVSSRLAELGIAVDVFTRASGQREPVTTLEQGVRVIHLEAGPSAPVPKEDLSGYLCEFLYALVRFEALEREARGSLRSLYDVVHSHYWLSGWVGRHLADRWNVPLVHSFHTLGRVKNATRALGEPPEPAERIAAEERIVETADCVLAPTVDEAAELVRLYRARPERIRVVAPGVDTEIFRPAGAAARAVAKASLGLAGRRVVLFVGRLQPLKAPEVAVRAVAEAARMEPSLDPELVIVGGPSGRQGIRPEALQQLATDLGIGGSVRILDPVPHRALPQLYRAADVVIVPSRSESFGLVGVESAACGTPVVATDVGGLRTVVRDGLTGLLVPGNDPRDFGAALAKILTDRSAAESMGEAAARFARRFDWRRAASGLLEAYEDSVARHALGGAHAARAEDPGDDAEIV